MRGERFQIPEDAHLELGHARPGRAKTFDGGELETVDDLSEGLKVVLSIAALCASAIHYVSAHTQARRMNLASRTARSSIASVMTI